MVLFWKVKYEEHGITNVFVYDLKKFNKSFGTGDMIYFIYENINMFNTYHFDGGE